MCADPSFSPNGLAAVSWTRLPCVLRFDGDGTRPPSFARAAAGMAGQGLWWAHTLTLLAFLPRDMPALLLSSSAFSSRAAPRDSSACCTTKISARARPQPRAYPCCRRARGRNRRSAVAAASSARVRPAFRASSRYPVQPTWRCSPASPGFLITAASSRSVGLGRPSAPAVASATPKRRRETDGFERFCGSPAVPRRAENGKFPVVFVPVAVRRVGPGLRLRRRQLLNHRMLPRRPSRRTEWFPHSGLGDASTALRKRARSRPRPHQPLGAPRRRSTCSGPAPQPDREGGPHGWADRAHPFMLGPSGDLNAPPSSGTTVSPLRRMRRRDHKGARGRHQARARRRNSAEETGVRTSCAETRNRELRCANSGLLLARTGSFFRVNREWIWACAGRALS